MRFRGRVLSASDAVDIARFLPLLSEGGVALLDSVENRKMLGDVIETGNTGRGDCIEIFCFTVVVGVGGNGTSKYSCLTLGSPELDGESVGGLSLSDLCKKPGGDGEVYATKFDRPGGVVDERVLSGVRGR